MEEEVGEGGRCRGGYKGDTARLILCHADLCGLDDGYSFHGLFVFLALSFLFWKICNWFVCDVCQ